ncbi:MAG TPA: PorV/PorQ family protein [Gemmatimonadales bacterium]|nr:PorV/PorQ family protein [Gemmatimonadales bacterium]
MIKLLSRRLSAIAVAMVIAVPATAQVAGSVDNTAYGGASGEFLLLGAGARGAALGGAFAALSTDLTAMYYNPAGLAQLARPAAMFSSYKYVADTKYSWAGIAFPMSGGVRSIGVSLGTFGFSSQPVYTVDNPDGDGRTYSVSETFVSFTYGQNFSDRFAAGFSAKFIRDGLGETNATGFAVDFGTSFHASVGSRPIRAAFVLQNLGTTLKHDGPGLNVGVVREPPLGTPQIPQETQPSRLRASGWTLPVLFRVSAALDLWTQGLNRVTLLSEFNQPNNTKPGAGAGVEWAVSNIGNSGFSLAARGSYTINPDNNISDVNMNGLTTSIKSGSFTGDGLALGGGLGYTRGTLHFGFDYAYRNLGPLGGTNFLSFAVGW